MQSNRGKGFEDQFISDWSKLPNSLALRLPDQQSGYYGTSANPCDFICYAYPNMYMIETKSHKGNTFPFSAFRQYDKLKKYAGIDGVKVGVVLWLYDHDWVGFIPIRTFIKLEEDGKKSFNVKYVESGEYESYTLPSVKKRIYMETDYSFLVDLSNNNVV